MKLLFKEILVVSTLAAQIAGNMSPIESIRDLSSLPRGWASCAARVEPCYKLFELKLLKV